MDLYPIYFNPVYKTYVWGGKKISTTLNRKNVPAKVAESWEIADRQEGMSVVVNGSYQGLSLQQLVHRFGKELLGKEQDSFPLLIKIIDAEQNLSIQVHPDNVTAKKLQAEPKTEMWYGLQNDCAAEVIAGFATPLNSQQFLTAVANSTLVNHLKKHTIAKDDAIFIPGGTIHAILKGAFVLEVQQNSNTTYRIYDWGRKRELHLEKAAKALHFTSQENFVFKGEPNKDSTVVSCPFFHVEKFCNAKIFTGPFPSFQVIFVLSGQGNIIVDDTTEPCFFGRTFLVPAAAKKLQLEALSEPFSFLKISL